MRYVIIAIVLFQLFYASHQNPDCRRSGFRMTACTAIDNEGK